MTSTDLKVPSFAANEQNILDRGTLLTAQLATAIPMGLVEPDPETKLLGLNLAFKLISLERNTFYSLLINHTVLTCLWGCHNNSLKKKERKRKHSQFWDLTLTWKLERRRELSRLLSVRSTLMDLQSSNIKYYHIQRAGHLYS